MGYLALVPFPMLGQRLYLFAGNTYVLAHLEKQYPGLLVTTYILGYPLAGFTPSLMEVAFFVKPSGLDNDPYVYPRVPVSRLLD